MPYRIHTVLTDNGIRFAEPPRNRNAAWSRQMRFDMICEANDIGHRLTKPNHPRTSGQGERMNRTIKEATVKRFHDDSHGQLRQHLGDFMAACNFARRLRTPSGVTPCEDIAKIRTAEPDRFIVDPIQQMPGLNASESDRKMLTASSSCIVDGWSSAPSPGSIDADASQSSNYESSSQVPACAGAR